MRSLIASIFIFQITVGPLAFAEAGKSDKKFDVLDEKCAELTEDPVLGVFIKNKLFDQQSYSMIREFYEQHDHQCSAFCDQAFHDKLVSRLKIHQDGDTEGRWACNCGPSIHHNPGHVDRIAYCQREPEPEHRVEQRPEPQPEVVERSHPSTYYSHSRRDDDGWGRGGGNGNGGGLFGGNGGGFSLASAGIGLGFGVLLGQIMQNRQPQSQFPGWWQPPMQPGMMPPGMMMPPGGGMFGGAGMPFGGRPSLPFSYPAPGGGGFNSYGFGGGYGAINGYSANRYGGYTGVGGVGSNMFNSPIYNSGGQAPIFMPYQQQH